MMCPPLFIVSKIPAPFWGDAIVANDFLNSARYGRCMNEAYAQRILLAEDDQAMRAYLARALENAGYIVDSVDRGTAALPYLEEQHYDLLLSDIVMP